MRCFCFIFFINFFSRRCESCHWKFGMSKTIVRRSKSDFVCFSLVFQKLKTLKHRKMGKKTPPANPCFFSNIVNRVTNLEVLHSCSICELDFVKANNLSKFHKHLSLNSWLFNPTSNLWIRWYLDKQKITAEFIIRTFSQLIVRILKATRKPQVAIDYQVVKRKISTWLDYERYVRCLLRSIDPYKEHLYMFIYLFPQINKGRITHAQNTK